VTKALLVTLDELGEEIGGNAIRSAELASLLTAHAEVTLAAPGSTPSWLSQVRHVPFELADPRSLRPELAAADVIVTPPQGPLLNAWLRRSPARVVYDVYDPHPLEALETYSEAGPARARLWSTVALDQLLEAFHTGHHFVCASERQRDLLIGMMLAERLITRSAYRRDPTLRALIDVVPFGVPEAAPRRLPGAGVRARFEAIGASDEVILWNGGIWNWLDPDTAIRAVARLAERRSSVRLVFMGRPPLQAHGSETARVAQELAGELGILDRIVFFNDRWVPYAERGSWLMDAACALSTQRDHLEARYSFRTRLLDCFWAGLPVVCSQGDELSERVSREDLGASVPPGDVAATAAALEGVLERGRADYEERLAKVAAEYRWSRMASPLIRYVTSPEPATAPGRGLAARTSSPARRARALAIRLGRGSLARLR
jgi:glycosyltransferase involved in cell wall biosynthesis